MTWTRISDNWEDRVDGVELSPEAERFAVRAMVACNRGETDGYLSATAIRKVGSVFADPDTLVLELIEKFGWTEAARGGVQIPWDDQESSEDIERRRRSNRERQRKFQQKGQKMREEREAKQDGVTGSVTLPPSRPVPSQGQGKGKGRENLGSASPPPVVPADAVLPDGPSVSQRVTMGKDDDDPTTFMICGDMENDMPIMKDAVMRAEMKLRKHETQYEVWDDGLSYCITIMGGKELSSSYMINAAILEANKAASQS